MIKVTLQKLTLRPFYTTFVATGLLLSHPHAEAAGRVSSVEISVPKTSEYYSVSTSATDVNDVGQVSGNIIYTFNNFSFSQSRRAFVFDNGAFTQYIPLAGNSNIFGTYAYSINNFGYATGISDSTNGSRFVTFKDGITTDLGNGIGLGINDLGWVVGYSNSNSSPQAFVYNSQSTISLSPFVGTNSIAYDVNDLGQVVGRNSANHAFLYSNGNAQDLGTLGGSNSVALSINNSGTVVGSSSTSGGASHAFVYENNTLRDLGTLGGQSSSANKINNNGQIVGTSDGKAFLFTGIKDSALINLNSIAPSGRTLTNATSINNVGQILAYTDQGKSVLLTLHPDWQGGNGSWDDFTHWNFAGLGSMKNLTPGLPHDVMINSNASIAIKGSANTLVHTLTLNGTPGQLISLNLNGGNTSTTAGTTLKANTQMTGNGTLGGDLTLESGSQLRVNSSETMMLTGGIVTNNGQVRLWGNGGNSANLMATSTFNNHQSGQINLQNANADFIGGLTNHGIVTISAGNSNISGNIVNVNGSGLLLSGNSNTTFYDSMEIQTGAEMRVSTGSSVTFFGQVIQRTGALMTGSGNKFYEGGLSIGASPGFVQDAGNISLGQNNVYLAEIGGTTACTLLCATNDAIKNSSYDQLKTLGHLHFGGVLKLTSWNGFVGAAGQQFDLFDWSTNDGLFASIDASEFNLADGTVMDFSRLYTDGVISLTSAVPENNTASLIMVGLGLVGLRRRASLKFKRSTVRQGLYYVQ